MTKPQRAGDGHPWHPRLAGQLAMLGLEPDSAPVDPGAWQRLLSIVDADYRLADRVASSAAVPRWLRIPEQPPLARATDDPIDAADPSGTSDHDEDIAYTIDLEGHFTSLNDAAERLTGYRREELLGQHYSIVLPPEQRLLVETMTTRKLQGADITRFEIDVLARDGKRVALELNTTLVHQGDRAIGVAGAGRRISARERQERQLRYMATHDSLTGLPNRGVLASALEDASISVAGDDSIQVLMFLDLDNFKLVNDSLGHAAGDEVLQTIAGLLRSRARSEDLVVRLGGDEFAVLLSCRSVEDASAIAESFREAIEQADIRVADERFYVGASIGLSVVNETDDPGQALSRADAAMYRAKERGRNRILWADAGGEREGGGLAPATQIATEIRTALATRAFEVHYQPVVRLADSKVVHYEALVRMQGSNGQLVAPSAFIPTAENFGLIGQIDRFVIDAALDELVRSPLRRIFVNISGVTMADDDLLEHLEAVLDSNPSLGRRLGFEITETAVVRDLITAGSWMSKLTAKGCDFALDDFGTGFSSLTYVRSLPVTQIKLDGTFTRGIQVDAKQRAVVSTVQALADVLHLETVAECIENATTLRILTEMGITFGQGYYLGRPSISLDSAADRAA